MKMLLEGLMMSALLLLGLGGACEVVVIIALQVDSDLLREAPERITILFRTGFVLFGAGAVVAVAVLATFSVWEKKWRPPSAQPSLEFDPQLEADLRRQRSRWQRERNQIPPGAHHHRHPKLSS